MSFERAYDVAGSVKEEFVERARKAWKLVNRLSG
jgi:hypothetical protein